MTTTAQEGRDARKRDARKRTASVVVEIVLWAFALVALGSVAFQLIDSALYQQRAAERLETGLAPELSTLPPDDDGADLGGTPDQPAAPPPSPDPIPAGAPVATLEIPSLSISAVVAHGDSKQVLRRAIGHLPGTALPGADGNVALAAHRDTFFRGLGDIAEGDEVYLDTSDGTRHAYRVVWTEVVEPSDVEVIWPTERPSLTLITCYPFRWIGPAPRRFVVRAELLPPTPPLTATRTHPLLERRAPDPIGAPAESAGTLAGVTP